MKLKANEAKEGFSLVEMIVAIGLFTAVSAALVGSILVIMDANRRARATEVVFNNINFVLEDMTRRARTGTDYHCQVSGPPSSVETDQDCLLPSGGKLFAFEKHNGVQGDEDDQVVYWFDAHPSVAGALQLKKSSEGGANSSPVTPAEVIIEKGSFYSKGVEDPDFQPMVVVVLSGYVKEGNGQTYFDLQTTITQRVPGF
jgi:type II secretory pathway pseudopilin PulG